jgi:hypothetical protein
MEPSASAAVENNAPQAAKEDRYLALYVCDGQQLAVRAKTATELKAALAGIPQDQILEVWKGRKKVLKTKTVLDF